MFTKIVDHRVGNKINGESLILSQEELQLDEGTVEMLENYFLGSFKTEETYQFYSDSYLVNNPVFSSVSEIFDDKAKFLWEAENIAKHLFEAAENPRVQGGELFIVFFEDERESEERSGEEVSFAPLHETPPVTRAGFFMDRGIAIRKRRRCVSPAAPAPPQAPTALTRRTCT